MSEAHGTELTFWQRNKGTSKHSEWLMIEKVTGEEVVWEVHSTGEQTKVITGA